MRSGTPHGCGIRGWKNLNQENTERRSAIVRAYAVNGNHNRKLGRGSEAAVENNETGPSGLTGEPPVRSIHSARGKWSSGFDTPAGNHRAALRGLHHSPAVRHHRAPAHSVETSRNRACGKRQRHKCNQAGHQRQSKVSSHCSHTIAHCAQYAKAPKLRASINCRPNSSIWKSSKSRHSTRRSVQAT